MILDSQKSRLREENLKTKSMCDKPTQFSDHTGRSVRCHGCFLLGFLVIFSLMPFSVRSVAASCGDYLHHSRDLPIHPLMHIDSFPDELISEVSLPSDPTIPCHGPHCRSNPTPIAPASAPTLITWNSETAALLQTTLATLGEWVTPIYPISQREFVSGGRSIFRPPRV